MTASELATVLLDLARQHGDKPVTSDVAYYDEPVEHAEYDAATDSVRLS